MFRNINQLGDWIEPSYDLARQLHEKSLPVKDVSVCSPSKKYIDVKLIKTIAEVWNTVFDDIYCIVKMKAFRSQTKPKLYKYASMQADRAWIVGILLNLYNERRNLIRQEVQWNSVDDHIEKQTLSRQRLLSLVNIVKLLCDLVFVCK